MKKLNDFLFNRDNNALLWVTGVLTVLICAVMNLFLIPAIEKDTGDLRCFDMNPFGLGYEQARQFVSLLGESEKNLYLHVQLPLDFIYPIAYALFFTLLIVKITGKGRSSAKLPVALAFFDYAENILTIIMLKTDFSSDVALLARCFTSMKTIAMYMTFGYIVLMLIALCVRKNRREKKYERGE